VGKWTVISQSEIAGKFRNLEIGDNCAIGRVMIQLHDRVEIGNNVVINDGVRILTGSHNVHSPDWELVTSPVTIGDFVWIATGSLVLPGVVLGRGSVVAAGAVVSRSVAPLEIVAGNPARAIGMRKTSEFNYRPSEGYAVFEAWLGRGQR
jgi:acetyltransferase-like isoleucine patch superfamily enzyme